VADSDTDSREATSASFKSEVGGKRAAGFLALFVLDKYNK